MGKRSGLSDFLTAGQKCQGAQKNAPSMRKERWGNHVKLRGSCAENVRRHHLPEDGELRRGYKNKGEDKDEPEL